MSSNEAAVSPFIECFKKKIAELNLSPNQIKSTMQTIVTCFGDFCHVRHTCTEKKQVLREEKYRRIESHLCRAPIVLEHKLKLLIIGKAKNPRPFKNIRLPVVYKNQNKALVTKELFYDWFHHDFVPEIKRFLKDKNLPQKALLVLDNALGHCPNDELSSSDGSVQTIFMPLNCTPLLQPMDQNVIQITKRRFWSMQ